MMVLLLLLLIIVAVCFGIFQYSVHSLKSQKVRERNEKIVMAAACIVLAVWFGSSAIYQAAPLSAAAKELSQVNFKTAKTEDWSTGNNEEYINQLLTIYDTIEKYDIGEENFGKKYRTSFEKELRNLNKITDGSSPAEVTELNWMFGDVQIEDDDCWYYYDIEEDKDDFYFKEDGYQIIAYCKKHDQAVSAYPYHLYDHPCIKELEEKAGLTGLGETLKNMEKDGFEITTVEGEKAKLSDYIGNPVIGDISILVGDDYVEFQYNEGLLDNYQYLTELNEKLKKDNWQNGVIYSKGYFKAEYIYLSDTSDDNQDDKVEAKVIYDQEGVTQISVKLNLFEANGSSVTDENKFEKIGALMEEIGANQNDVMKLLKSLNCKSADKTGKLGDLSYQVKVSGVGMDEESNDTYADCVLIVSK
jgi:hypothetical protein